MASTEQDPYRPLRSDALRNSASIRAAALAAFRGRGLGTPLAQIAAAAGVSKASIYNHFDGRRGLIEAVIDELVVLEIRQAMQTAAAESDPWVRVVRWVEARRDLQFREPAFTDTMTGEYHDATSLADLARSVTTFTNRIVRTGHHAGVLRPDLTTSDVFWADVANGLALREMRTPRRSDYDRRTRQFVDSLRNTER